MNVGYGQKLRLRKTFTGLNVEMIRKHQCAKEKVKTPTMQLQSGATTDRVPHRNSKDQKSSDNLNYFITSSLEDSKAENIVAIDVKGKNPIFDSIVVASGRSHRHVKAIAENLLRNLKSKKLGAGKAEGINNCDWVLIDAGDAVVHIFRPEVREFYNIEKMWSVENTIAP